MAGRVFDAQVVLSPADSSLGKLLRQYVCARIIRMDNMDIGLFDHDWHNTIYYFVMNGDEQIYLRYGGRDTKSPDSHLDLNSLTLALEQGLQLHRRRQQGQLPAAARPAPLFARQMPLLVERTIARGACVECHLIADYQNQQRELDGTLDRPTHMFRSPDLQTLGIVFDVPRGLVVKEARGTVAAAGMKPGDRIAKLNGATVWTFADLQYQYDKVDRRARSVTLSVDRDGQAADLAVSLPERWWYTDVTFRHWTIDPRVYFDSRPLSEAEKRKYELDPAGFAAEVTAIDRFIVENWKVHQLQPGDIVFGVDGVQRDEMANTPELFIRLRKKAGQSVMLDVIRGGQRMQMELHTQRPSFRK